MAGYTRLSRPDITNGADITAPPLNAEFDQIETAFGTTGHTHDGTAGNAPKIDLATSVAGYLKQVNGGVGGANNTTATSNPTITDDTVAGYAKGSLWLNTTTSRIYVCVSDTASAAAWYELAATNTANNILPSGDGVVDLGAVGNRFADLLMAGDATIGGSITVTAASSFSNNVDVTGALDVGGDLTVDSNTTVAGNTTLNGNTTIGNAGTDTVAINAEVSTNIVPASTNIDLGTAADEFRDLYIDGTAHIDTLDVDESATVAANLTVEGITSLNGNTNIGNANTDTVAVNAQVSTNIVPNSDDARDLGEATKEFRNLFLDGTAHIDTLDVDESATVAVNLTVGGNAQIDTNLDVDGVTTLNGNTTIGDANTDVLYVNSEIATSLVPSATNLRDLGTATKEFRDLYLDGTAHIDTLDVDENATVAGTLGVTGNTTLTGTLTTGGITGTSATFSSNVDVTGTATIATVDINGGNIDATQIGVTNPDTARFTTVETSGLASLASVDIDGGNIDGTIIGATTPDTATFTTATANNGFTGDLAGNVTASTGTSTFDNLNATGTITGNVTGDITGNVNASTGSSTFNDVTINGTLNMDAGTTATITNLSTPVNPGDAASKGYVDSEVAALVDAAPAALDTLNELAAAINDDANFSTTITNSIATKLPLAGGTMSGAIDMGANKVTNAADPTAAQDLSTKAYTDQQDALQVSKSGDSMSGNLAMGSNNITGLATPTANDHAATKGYTDGILGSATAASASAAAAATSENNAAASATAAAGSASTANTAKQDAIDALDEFTDIYLGAKSSAPSTDNDGDALDTGAIYWDTTDEQLYVYDGTNWQQAAFTLGSSIANVIEDTTPQLGGDLDLNTNTINGTGNINITGTITSSGAITGDLTGNADTATALQTGRSIALGGDVSGSATFDGTGDITITAVVADDSHNHTIANVDGLQSALDAKQPSSTALTTSTTFGGDVSGTYNNIVIADDSHNHVISNVDGLQSALDGKLSTTGKAADSELLDGVNGASYLRSDTADTASNLTIDTLAIGSSNQIKFANNDYILYDDADGVGAFKFNVDADTENAKLKAGEVHAAADMYVANRVFHVGDTDTYTQFPAANTWRVVTGNTESMKISGGNIDIPNAIRHTGDTDTYLQFDAANSWRVVTGGVERIQVNSSGVGIGNTGAGGTFGNGKAFAIGDSDTGIRQNGDGVLELWANNQEIIDINTSRAFFYKNIDMGGRNVVEVEDIGLRDRIYHDDDTDTYIQFHTGNQFRVVTGGSERFEVNNTRCTMAQDLTVNGGDIILGGTGRIQGIDTVSSGTDATNKNYVDNAVGNAASMASMYTYI